MCELHICFGAWRTDSNGPKIRVRATSTVLETVKMQAAGWLEHVVLVLDSSARLRLMTMTLWSWSFPGYGACRYYTPSDYLTESLCALLDCVVILLFSY